MAEQRTENPRVGGSIPSLATSFLINDLRKILGPSVANSVANGTASAGHNHGEIMGPRNAAKRRSGGSAGVRATGPTYLPIQPHALTQRPTQARSATTLRLPPCTRPHRRRGNLTPATPVASPTFQNKATPSTMLRGLKQFLQKSKRGRVYDAVCWPIGFDIPSVRNLALLS